MATRRRRLDAELVRRGIAASRGEALEAIATGLVTVDGAPAGKASTLVAPGAALSVSAPPRRYVSRGGDKLAHGLDRFRVDPAGRHCLDAGASTGGFTDCLLQRGAERVVAVDVGYGQLHDRIRRDHRVVVLERTNARHLTVDDLDPPPPELIVADLSFISLALVLPGLLDLLAATPDAEAVALVKPQFEAGREHVGRGGVVRDPSVWRAVLRDVVGAVDRSGWAVTDVVASPLTGPAGNVEFLAHVTTRHRAGGDRATHIEQRVAAVVEEVSG